MARQCFLHVGADKTGSTSIQNALFYDLHDPQFQYISGGKVNGSIAFDALFMPPSHVGPVFHSAGSDARFRRFQRVLLRQLDRGFARAIRRECDAVFSAEACWLHGHPEQHCEGLLNLRDYIKGYNYEIRLLCYLRPWSSWASSLFQQSLKKGVAAVRIGEGRDDRFFELKDRLETFFSLFDRSRVAVNLFRPEDFPRRCVVHHFCRQIGMSVPAGRAWHSNESLSLPAVQLLFAYNRFNGIRGGASGHGTAGRGRLIQRLHSLPGPRFRLHPTLLDPWLEERRKIDSWLESTVGITLSEATKPTDAEHGVASEADLFRFEQGTREWIAKQVGLPVVREADGEAAARAIAAQVDLLRQSRPSPGDHLKGMRDGIRDAWIRRRYAR